ncbi:Sec1 family domain-containing protein 1 [Larimichthys crocea]|uniref:Uncharacterized protein n=1 Tax=Larimichthys crocea TaxID=215358 RepID=A0ACD3RRZ0_LARCR|nr:Sec1 family domain-containing protein 1 [Larimichthys crocea]
MPKHHFPRTSKTPMLKSKMPPTEQKAINRADIQDTDMEAIMDTIVDSLFCFFVTLGAVPIIRCPRGNAAEMVAVVSSHNNKTSAIIIQSKDKNLDSL